MDFNSKWEWSLSTWFLCYFEFRHFWRNSNYDGVLAGLFCGVPVTCLRILTQWKVFGLLLLHGLWSPQDFGHLTEMYRWDVNIYLFSSFPVDERKNTVLKIFCKVNDWRSERERGQLSDTPGPGASVPPNEHPSCEELLSALRTIYRLPARGRDSAPVHLP